VNVTVLHALECRPGDALEVPVPEVLKLAEKFSRAFGDDDPIRLGDSLQTPWSRIAWSSLGKHAVAGAVGRQSGRDQPLFSGQSTIHVEPATRLSRSARTKQRMADFAKLPAYAICEGVTTTLVPTGARR
jgi:hypothetical protein